MLYATFSLLSELRVSVDAAASSVSDDGGKKEAPTIILGYLRLCKVVQVV